MSVHDVLGAAGDTAYNGLDGFGDGMLGSQNVFRYDRHDGKLTLDESWGPVPYLQSGQTAACSWPRTSP